MKRKWYLAAATILMSCNQASEAPVQEVVIHNRLFRFSSKDIVTNVRDQHSVAALVIEKHQYQITYSRTLEGENEGVTNLIHMKPEMIRGGKLSDTELVTLQSGELVRCRKDNLALTCGSVLIIDGVLWSVDFDRSELPKAKQIIDDALVYIRKGRHARSAI